MNFQFIPGEIIPYAIFQAKKFRFWDMLILSSLTSLICIKLILISGSTDFYLFLLNGIELIIVFSFILFVRNADYLVKMVNTAVVLFFLTGILAYFVPEINDIKAIFVTRTIDSAVYVTHSRGIPFLSPEPSYAAIWFLGCHMYLLQYWRTAKSGVVLSLLGILLTLSIWGYLFLILFHTVRMLRKHLLRSFAIVISAIFLAYLNLGWFIELQSSEVRLIRALGLCVQFLFEIGILQTVIQVEEIFGSTRFIFLIENVSRPLSFFEYNYHLSNSVLAQLISVLGTIGGLSIFCFLLLHQIKGKNFLHAIWILSLLGPVILLPIYLLLLKQKKD